ncbi:cupin domain-containing protein [Candidatus Woesebacteria bacterium]|nr:cupin domain-containing protein [Candidatus Woesebacteria bacterium]
MNHLKGYVSDVKQIAKHNSAFRRVLETGRFTQVVVMSIPPGGEVGEETHTDTDQVVYLVKGGGRVALDDIKHAFKKSDLVLVHAGVKHNFINTGEEDMKIITMYSPPHHPDGTVHKTKGDAEKTEH